MPSMFEVIGWSIVVAFIATTGVTLLGIAGVLKIPSKYLGRLFAALILEIIAAGFFIFRQGLNPEQEYFRAASKLYQEALDARKRNDVEVADRLLGQTLALSTKNLPFEIRQVFRERGSIAFDKESWEPAAKSYAVYYEIQPDDLEALVRYGRALRETNKYQQALGVYERAERLSPNNYEVLSGLQNITRRLGAFLNDADRADAADGYFERTREYVTRMLQIAKTKEADTPRYRNGLLARSRLYWEWRRYPEALASYEKLIAEFPDYVRALEDYAAVLLEAGERGSDAGRLAAARDLYRKLYVERQLGSDLVYSGAGYAEAAALAPDTSSDILKEAERAVLLSLAELKSSQEDPYPFYAASLLFKRLDQDQQALTYLRSAARYERRRASDPYKFDYARLVKYERLLQRWELGK